MSILPGGECQVFLEEEPRGERSFTPWFLFQMPTTSTGRRVRVVYKMLGALQQQFLFLKPTTS
jgi:hypothetical protein